MIFRLPFLICVGLILGLSGCTGKSVGTVPPSFTLSDLSGESTSFNQFTGDPVMINFWSLSCPGCIEEMPFIQSVYVNNATTVKIITIAIRDSQSPVTQFMTDNNYSFPVLLDKFGTVAVDYNIRFTPTTYFIDSTGEIADIKFGPFANLTELEKMLDKLD